MRLWCSTPALLPSAFFAALEPHLMWATYLRAAASALGRALCLRYHAKTLIQLCMRSAKRPFQGVHYRIHKLRVHMGEQHCFGMPGKHEIAAPSACQAMLHTQLTNGCPAGNLRARPQRCTVVRRWQQAQRARRARPARGLLRCSAPARLVRQSPSLLLRLFSLCHDQILLSSHSHGVQHFPWLFDTTS